MAMFLFTDAILHYKPRKVFDEGKLSSYFTYIDYIVQGVENILLQDQPDHKKYSLYNIGNGSPVQLMDFISAIEDKIGKTAEKRMLTMQPGDVEKTWADTKAIERDYNYKPNTNISCGIGEFVDWYKDYFQV